MLVFLLTHVSESKCTSPILFDSLILRVLLTHESTGPATGEESDVLNPTYPVLLHVCVSVI